MSLRIWANPMLRTFSWIPLIQWISWRVCSPSWRFWQSTVWTFSSRNPELASCLRMTIPFSLSLFILVPSSLEETLWPWSSIRQSIPIGSGSTRLWPKWTLNIVTRGLHWRSRGEIVWIWHVQCCHEIPCSAHIFRAHQQRELDFKEFHHCGCSPWCCSRRHG